MIYLSFIFFSNFALKNNLTKYFQSLVCITAHVIYHVAGILQQ